VVRRIHHPV